MFATAAILRAFSAPLAIESVPIPRLEPGQALVQVEAAGVCGSDLHMWRGHAPRTPLPIILGHEGVGRLVDSAGPRHDLNGGALAPGARVLWERGVTCGECAACRVQGEPALCPERWTYGISRSFDRPPHLTGAYATHIVLDARTPLIALPDEGDPAPFVSASCSGATAAHALALAPVHAGDIVAVIGPGPLGAWAALLASSAGAAEVIVVGGTASRLAVCRRMGATLALDRGLLSLEERVAAVYACSHGRGADVVIEAAGNVPALEETLALVRPGGAVALVGAGAPIGEATLRPFEQVVRRNVRLQGVWVSDVRHTVQAVSLARQHPEAVAALVTHRFPLARADEALAAVAGREAMKAVLLPG
jgi:threonine dehydrogenase-like Zn-dependent dehydrogenase